MLVEGPSELTYLQSISALLETHGRKGLREDVTIVPVGGLSNVVTFVSLLGANGLKVGILHDYNGSPDQRIADLVKQKLLADKSVFNVSQFRDLTKLGQDTLPSDIEDLLQPTIYLDYFNKTYAKQLNGTLLNEKELPKGDRIVHRVERALSEKNIKVRPSGGFNHYAVAAAFGSSPPSAVDEETLNKFEALFEAINRIF